MSVASSITGGGGGSGGVSGLTTADAGTAIADTAIIRGNGTTGIQGSSITLSATTGVFTQTTVNGSVTITLNGSGKFVVGGTTVDLNGNIVVANGANLINVDYVRAGSSTSQKAAINRGTASIAVGLALASDRSIAISNGSSSESGFDIELKRVGTSILALGDGSTGGASLELTEMTAPGAPGANKGRLYLEDNGAGKSRLVVIFPSGAAQVLATEP